MSASINHFRDINSLQDIQNILALDIENELSTCIMFNPNTGLKQFAPSQNGGFFFKLQNVMLAGIESQYNATAGFAIGSSKNGSDLKLAVMIDTEISDHVTRWFQTIFPGLEVKTAEEFKNNSKEPRMHIPIKTTKSGTPLMNIKIGIDTEVRFEKSVPNVSGKLVESGPLVWFNYSILKDKRADVFVRVSDLWCADNCVGLKLNIHSIDVKNKF